MVTIREMQIDDLEQVMRIEEENFSVPWTETGFFSFLIREDTLFLVAEEAKEILGYCGVVTASGEGDITNVAVKRSRQKEGIGGRMLAELLARLEGAGVGTLFLRCGRGMPAPFICTGNWDLRKWASGKITMRPPGRTVLS